jgi:hypothetical protein
MPEVTDRALWRRAAAGEAEAAYDIPGEHEQPGHLAVAVIGLDEDGKDTAHQCLPIPPEELARRVPEAASLCERRN